MKKQWFSAYQDQVCAWPFSLARLPFLPKLPDVISPRRPLIPDAPEPEYFALSQELISALQLINGTMVLSLVAHSIHVAPLASSFFQTNIIPLRIVFDRHQFPTNCPSTE